MWLRDALGVFLVIMSVLVGLNQTDAMSAPTYDMDMAHLVQIQGHIPTHASEQHASPTSRCHDAGERCCAHMMSCCVTLTAAILGNPDAHQHAPAALIANNCLSYLAVPELPPRI